MAAHSSHAASVSQPQRIVSSNDHPIKPAATVAQT
jgi:hypothetical protein